jgi:hypothetical protein
MKPALQRLLEQIAAEAETWPNWKRREVGLPPKAPPFIFPDPAAPNYHRLDRPRKT